MNILLSAYSINPYKGSEDAVGWNWALTLSRKLPDSTIYILTRTYNEIATKKGIKEYGLQNVKLVIVEVPKALDWFREKHSALDACVRREAFFVARKERARRFPFFGQQKTRRAASGRRAGRSVLFDVDWRPQWESTPCSQREGLLS